MSGSCALVKQVFLRSCLHFPSAEGVTFRRPICTRQTSAITSRPAAALNPGAPRPHSLPRRGSEIRDRFEPGMPVTRTCDADRLDWRYRNILRSRQYVGKQRHRSYDSRVDRPLAGRRDPQRQHQAEKERQHSTTRRPRISESLLRYSSGEMLERLYSHGDRKSSKKKLCLTAPLCPLPYFRWPQWTFVRASLIF